MITLFLLKIIAIHAYYLGIELDEEIKVSLIQVSALQPIRKLGLNESSLVKTQFLDSVTFTNRRFFSNEALEAAATSQASGRFDSFAWLHNPKNDLDLFKLNNLELISNQSFESIKTGRKLESYSSQESQFMILENIKNNLKKNFDFKGTVFAVPNFLSQSQRIYLRDLAQSSQLKPLSFVHEDSLSALLVALDRLDEKEKHVLAFNMKSGYVSASLIKLSAVTVNKGKVSEKKLENVQIVKTEYSFEFGWKDIQNHLAQTLLNAIRDKCLVDIAQDHLSLAKLKGKVLKLIKKLALGVMVIVKFDDIIQGCASSLEVNQSLIQDFIDINKEKIIKPANTLLSPDLNISSIILSHSSEAYLEKVLSTIGKIKIPANDHQIAIGAGLVATNYSDEVHVRHLILNQNFQFQSKAEIISKASGKLRTKTLFDSESIFGTSKKVGFSSDEDLTVRLAVDYGSGSGFEVVSEYDVADLEFLAKKYLQVPFVSLEFVLNEFGIVLLARAEAKVEVELEFEKEIKKEKSKKNGNDTDNESLNNTENENSTESSAEASVKETAESTNENIDNQVNPSPSTPNTTDPLLSESLQPTNPPESSPTSPEGNSTSPEDNSTPSESESDPAPSAEPEEDLIPQYEIYLKKKSIKHSLSLNPQQVSQTAQSALPLKNLSKLSDLSSHESKASELASLQSSLHQNYDLLSSSLSSSDLQFFISPDESLLVSSLNSSALQSCSPVSKCKSLSNRLHLLLSHLAQRKNEYSSLDSVKNFMVSSFNSLENDLKEQVKAKPWLPAEEVAELGKEINSAHSSLLAAYEKQRQSGPSHQIEFTIARVQGKLARLAYKLQVLSKLKQKKTDL